MGRLRNGVLFVVLFVILPASLVFAQSQQRDIRRFEPNDTLEEIREKIEYNGYNFTVDHNWVFDMPPYEKEQFFSRRFPAWPAHRAVSEDIGPLERHLGKSLPTSFDWRNYNGHAYIGDIRDQGACGSCYAFGACAAAEGTYNYAMGLYDGNCADFSESYVIWCLGSLPAYSSHFFGCGGADWDYAELTAFTVEGVGNESDFPYTTSDPGSCTHWGDPTTVFQSWHRVPCGDVDAIKTAIMTYGVVDAAVYAGAAFQGYSGDVYEDANTTCPPDPGIGPECYHAYTNHAIALVGWDDNGDPENNGYWILRNSWNTTWGESGYMRIKYHSARVACEVCYLVYVEPATPTPTPTWDPAVPTYTPTTTPTDTPTQAPTSTPTNTPTVPAPTPQPQAEVDLNGVSLGGGDQFTTRFQLNRSIERPFTAYAVIILPNGSMLDAITLSPYLKPVAVNVTTLSAPFSYLLLDTTIPAGAPSGVYEIVVVFFDPSYPITGREDAFLDASSFFAVGS